jgi:hypothetical protein
MRLLLAAPVRAKVIWTGTVWIAMFCAGIAGARASDPAIDSTPDAASAAASPGDDKHILGVIPNYAAVNDPPKVFHSITAGEKFVIAAHDSFDPFNWLLAGVYGAVYQWQNDYPRWGQGASGYAKRYGATFADGAISTYVSEGVLPTLLHEDPRYFRMGHGPKWRRTGYALTRVLITKTDSGGDRFNNSEIEGNLVAASLANLYYPPANRSLGDTLQKFGINVLSDAGFNVLREFWPDMKHKVLHR